MKIFAYQKTRFIKECHFKYDKNWKFDSRVLDNMTYVHIWRNDKEKGSDGESLSQTQTFLSLQPNVIDIKYFKKYKFKANNPRI